MSGSRYFKAFLSVKLMSYKPPPNTAGNCTSANHKLDFFSGKERASRFPAKLALMAVAIVKGIRFFVYPTFKHLAPSLVSLLAQLVGTISPTGRLELEGTSSWLLGHWVGERRSPSRPARS